MKLLTQITIGITAISLFAWLVVGSSSNLEWVKERASEKWHQQGFEVVDYEGFQWGPGGFGTPYGGARVWYRVKRGNGGTIHSGYLKRWGNEVHVYGPSPSHSLYN